jgi:hypothetical protein
MKTHFFSAGRNINFTVIIVSFQETKPHIASSIGTKPYLLLAICCFEQYGEQVLTSRKRDMCLL